MFQSPIIPEVWSQAGLRRHQRRLVSELAKAYPNPVKTRDLVGVLFGDDPEGGPNYGSHAVSAMIPHIRARVEKVGWTIPPSTIGPMASGYRLEPISGDAS